MNMNKDFLISIQKTKISRLRFGNNCRFSET